MGPTMGPPQFTRSLAVALGVAAGWLLVVAVIAAVAESGAGVLLIEQFAAVALGLAHRAHIMEGGRIRFSGLASELRDNPARLRSAYLLRGSKTLIPNDDGIPPRSSSS